MRNRNRTLGQAIEKALDDFYTALDEIAMTKPDVLSPEWLGFVEGQIGSGGVMEGYCDWVQDAWEPLEDREQPNA